ERGERWQTVADSLLRLRELANDLAEPRPDVAEVITSSIAQLCTVDRAARLVEHASEKSAHTPAANAIVGALGSPIGGAIIEAIQVRQWDSKHPMNRAASQLLVDHAAVVAPALVAAISAPDVNTTRLVARVLGLAGTGHEDALAQQLASRD